MSDNKKIYFASDFHLGLRAGTDPMKREKHVVRWLDSVKNDASAIYLVGDLFDFWWEYKKVVPNGFTRFLGKISELTDNGIQVHFFTGNHDMWIGKYFSEECGMILHTKPVTLELLGRVFHIAHGEGLGSDDRSYKLLLWIFRNRFLRVLYSALHPAIGVGLGHRWSLSSRLAKSYSKPFMGEENEPLFRYSNKLLEKSRINYFIFGHRHIAIDHILKGESRIFILGNWFNAPSFVSWDGENIALNEFPSC